ncbi:MAG: preprotein translocase subunit SecG [Candidatus Eremiobacterota bacterium]
MFYQFINSLILTLAQASAPAADPVVQSVKVPGSSTSISPFTIVMLVVYFIVSACLVFTILSQTTKSEGLSGTLGGRTESVFKGKGVKSLEDKLNQITTGLAITFLVLSTIISIIGL